MSLGYDSSTTEESFWVPLTVVFNCKSLFLNKYRSIDGLIVQKEL
jgi:hypothetical protein